MRRFVAVFVTTVAGLVVLLSFKTAPAKAPRPVALSGVSPGDSSGPPASLAPVSPAPVSPAPVSSAPVGSASASSAPVGSASASSAPPSTAAPSTKAATASRVPSTTKTVTGSTVTVGEGRRQFGVVQVRLTLTNGKITAVSAVQFPDNDGHSADLSRYSIPMLSQEVLSAQSASINAVSGATYTSDAYAQSVQAALDAAKA